MRLEIDFFLEFLDKSWYFDFSFMSFSVENLVSSGLDFRFIELGVDKYMLFFVLEFGGFVT